ncbi:hypothetical protein JTT07_13205 [Clostridium botulinum]|nr:hypothetical protein [Clostridium botulinum]
MYDIIIFGTGSTSNFVTGLLNDNVEILAYVDNDSNKWENIIIIKK